jgi:hypothetical protein
MALQRLKEAAEKAKIEALEHDGNGNQSAVRDRRISQARNTWR